MRQVVAIARLAVAAAIRLRMLPCVVVLLLLVLLGFPLTVRGDGTAEGLIVLVVNYTLGIAVALLALAAVWAGSAAISTEIQKQQAHLVLTKPVSVVQVWLGKWSGLTLLIAALLALSGALAYGMLQLTLARAHFPEAKQAELASTVLLALQPTQPSIDHDEHADDEHHEQAMFIVPHKEHRTWRFDVPESAPSNKDALLAYRFSSSKVGVAAMSGTWSFGRPDAQGYHRADGGGMSRHRHHITIPAAWVVPGEQLLVTFENTSAEPMTVVFDSRDGLILRTYAGHFAGNYLRALLVFLAPLTLLAALGVSMGALLSTPVAVFASYGVGAVTLLAGHLSYTATTAASHAGHDHGAVSEPGLFDAVMGMINSAIAAMLSPLAISNPLEKLATGDLVSWATTGWTWAVHLLYIALLGLLATRIMRKREIGLPD